VTVLGIRLQHSKASAYAGRAATPHALQASTLPQTQTLHACTQCKAARLSGKKPIRFKSISLKTNSDDTPVLAHRNKACNNNDNAQ
jgi:hypothetical protein